MDGCSTVKIKNALKKKRKKKRLRMLLKLGWVEHRVKASNPSIPETEACLGYTVIPCLNPTIARF